MDAQLPKIAVAEYLAEHIATLAAVMSFLYFTEGTLALGSKWCTYCLIYSAVYASEPVWGPPAYKNKLA